MSSSDKFTSNLQNTIRDALKQWNDDKSNIPEIESLFLFRRLLFENSFDRARAKRQLLQNVLDKLRSTHPEDADLLELRFRELASVHQLANHFHIADSTFYVTQRNAVSRYADCLLKLNDDLQAIHKVTLNRRLESPTYVNLIGVQQYVDSIYNLLLSPAPPWIVLVAGIGGIGKTSLVHATVAKIIESGKIDEVSWVSAKQERFNLGGAILPVAQPALTTDALIERLLCQLLPDLSPGISQAQKLIALQSRLKAIPHIIVIDNLETLQDVTTLLPMLQTLSNPTKFVLTSRTNLHGEPNVYHLLLPELDKAATIELIRQEARHSNADVLSTATDEELMPIIETVGGNPLALRLVVGQTHVHNLDSILEHLRRAHGESVESLYTYIYRYAWDRLDIMSQKAFLLMPLANPSGDDLSYLAEVGNIEEDVLHKALDQLVKLNLVDVRGLLNGRRYSIHGLTRTFLQEQVAKWQ